MEESQSLTDKKIFAKNPKRFDNECFIFNEHFKLYIDSFWVYRRNNFEMAKAYASGLMRCEKNHTNMERMSEFDDKNDYHRYYHFLSESQWSWSEVNRITALNASLMLNDQKSKNGLPVCFIIDESSHLKKGRDSVGVSRQYAGQIGKVDNCQVAVYGSLCNDIHNTLISTRLFLPQEWASDKQRMKNAGVPEEYRIFKTKPQLALDIIDEALKNGVCFDCIGGDGLYGHNSELTRALDKRKLFYVLDVHKDEHVYLTKPELSVPAKKEGRGRCSTKLKPDISPISLEKYRLGLNALDWQQVKVRKTAKGTKAMDVHLAEVWHWDGVEQAACRRTLMITVDAKSKRVKYSFSNRTVEEHTAEEYARFQCNRYWVERSFDDAKNELGLSGYQVRNWTAWQHHIALVMAATLYLMKRRIDNIDSYPLLSIRDARILTVVHLFCDEQTVQRAYQNMHNRHKARKRDIDRCYRKEAECHSDQTNFKV